MLSKLSSFETFLVVQRAFAVSANQEECPATNYPNGEIARRFGEKLHKYPHLSLDDMAKLYQGGKALNQIFGQGVKVVFEKSTSCKATARPIQSKRISFSKIFTSFNERVQVYFFYIQELGSYPCFPVVDTHPLFSAIAIQHSSRTDSTGKMFELLLIDMHGTPKIPSRDIEFPNAKFADALRNFGTVFQARPARPHNKL